MSAISELRKGASAPIKEVLFGGYDRTATEDMLAALTSQLTEAQENYGSRIEEIKARADALLAEKNRLQAREKELSDRAAELAGKNQALSQEKSGIAEAYERLRNTISQFSGETGISVEGYAQLCQRFSQLEDENAALKAENGELTKALKAKISENNALKIAYGKTLQEKETMREELYCRLTDAREERDTICSGFIEAASKQQSAAATLQSALSDALRLLDGLSLDAATMVASLHSKTV